MKTQSYILLVALWMTLFSCNSSEKKSELPVIDVTKSYSKKDIVLQDIADVEYIPLETKDDALLGEYISICFISNDKIITYNRKDGDVFFFDGKGHFLHTFNNQGQSGREYLTINNIIYDEANNELFIYDKRQGGGKIQVYSEKGEYKRSLSVANKELSKTTDENSLLIANEELSKIVDYDKKTLLAYERYFDASSISEGDKERRKNLTPFFFISKETGKIDTLRDFKLKDRESCMLMQMSSKSIMSIVVFSSSNIIPIEKQGSFILDAFAGDTIFEYTKERNLIPICLKTPSLKQQGEKSTLVNVANVSKDWIFTLLIIKDINVEDKEDIRIAVNRNNGEVSEYKLINEDVLTDSLEIKTKSELMNADKLVDLLEEGKLKGKLKDIAEKLNADDNPVLVKIKFKE